MLRFNWAPLAVLAASRRTSPADAEPTHAIAMHGEPKLAADFQHFPYVNPDAPKGGRVTLGTSGSFDSLNPMIVRGEPVQGMREFVIESLMARSQDEPFTLYGLIAETIDVPPDRGEVTFRINPKARFSDGKPVTADDVIFSLALLGRRRGPTTAPTTRRSSKVERLSDLEVRFVLAERRPRDAAHPRPHAGAAEARRRSRDVRGDEPRAADRLGPLPHRQRSIPAARSPTSATRTIGAAICR